MAIAAIIGSNLIKSVASRLTAPSQPVVKDSGDNDRAGAQVSQQGKFMSQLQQLQQQDPAKFKQFMANEATKLEDAASKTTGGEARKMTEMATKFQQAASSGDLTSFQPPPRPSLGNSVATQAAQAYKANSGQGHSHHGGGGVQQLLAGVASDLVSALSGASTYNATA